MSGTGSAMFGIFGSLDKAALLMKRLKKNTRLFLVKPVKDLMFKNQKYRRYYKQITCIGGIIMEKGKNKFKIWETALLLAVCITVLIGIWAQGQQQELSSKLIRLHVIASSDSEEDQELKLAVRDRVLEVLAPSLEGTQDVGEAAEIISGKLDLIENAAAETVRENGREYDVSVELGTEDYPTKQYEGFALRPANIRPCALCWAKEKAITGGALFSRPCA
jgi:stage II sporulation protein R